MNNISCLYIYICFYLYIIDVCKLGCGLVICIIGRCCKTNFCQLFYDRSQVSRAQFFLFKKYGNSDDFVFFYQVTKSRQPQRLWPPSNNSMILRKQSSFVRKSERRLANANLVLITVVMATLANLRLPTRETRCELSCLLVLFLFRWFFLFYF